MPAPLPDSVRQAVIDLLPTGKSCRAIAREVGISTNSVSRIAKGEGHTWGQVNAARAREAQSKYSAEWRADFAARLQADLDRMRDQLFSPIEVWQFGGRDNVLTRATVTEPSPQQKRDLVSAISQGMRTVLDIDRHDRQSEGDAVVDQVLAFLKGA